MGNYMSMDRALAQIKNWKIGGIVVVRGYCTLRVVNISAGTGALGSLVHRPPSYFYTTVINGATVDVELRRDLAVAAPTPEQVKVPPVRPASVLTPKIPPRTTPKNYPERIGGRRSHASSEIYEHDDKTAEEKIRKSSADGRPPSGIDGDLADF